MTTVTELGPRLGIAPTCAALGLPRAPYSRRRGPQSARAPRPRSPRALSPDDHAAVLARLHEPRFVDLAPAEVYATLLDEGEYLCSERTMYRVLAAQHEVRDRRDQLRHPRYAVPELLARRPNELWSWDITKLLGPAKWTYFYLYVMLDVFSRYVVGWMVAHRESATLAERFIHETCARQEIRRDQLTMYRPDFPERFGAIQDARAHCQVFFPWYNTEHRHTGLGLLTPHDVHYGLAEARVVARAEILAAAHAAPPERFPRGMPQPPPPPLGVWVNPPNTRATQETLLHSTHEPPL